MLMLDDDDRAVLPEPARRAAARACRHVPRLVTARARERREVQAELVLDEQWATGHLPGADRIRSPAAAA